MNFIKQLVDDLGVIDVIGMGAVICVMLFMVYRAVTDIVYIIFG